MTADEPAAPTAERIRAAALEHFVADGFNGTSMRDIASGVGVTAAALYYHYPGKEALLAAVTGPYLEDLETLLDKAGGDPPQIVLAAFLDLVLEHRDVVSFLERDGAASAHPPVADRLDGQVRRLRGMLLSPGRHDQEDLVRISAVLGAVIRPVLRFDDPGTYRDTILETASRLLD